MRIVQIIPGSGGSFYCGNCMRDSKYIDAIRQQGNEVLIVPMYLPLFPREENKDEVPVFYGAISLYLKQVYPLFRRMPAWFERFLDSPMMLKLAAGLANSTRSSGLESMTISMLQGEDGQQKAELEKLTHWLETHYKADIIHISNALLIGLAHSLKSRLQIPVVCTLQDEDVWVDAMNESFREPTWQLMAEKAKDIDCFFSVSHYFTRFMQTKLHLPDNQIRTLHLGVDPADYRYTSPLEKGRNIGFLSRLCKENGLDILVDAFILLKKKPELSDCTLILTGGHTADDNAFLAEQRHKLRQAGLDEYVLILDRFEQEERMGFFNQVSVLSVPVRNGEAFGIYLTEAMAAGVPVIQPELGAFPEIIAASGGGMIYGENTPQALAACLINVLTNEAELERLSLQARDSVQATFNIHHLAARLNELYRETIETYTRHEHSR